MFSGLVLFVAIVTLNAAAAVLAPVKVLNDGNKMPMLALGTHNSTGEAAFAATVSAIELGYRHIDTAVIYENEEQIGRAVADVVKRGVVKREDLFITTKLWNDKHSREDVVPALKEALGRLNLTYADLYLIHFPIGEKANDKLADTDYLETWMGMEDAKKLGLAKSIGVSNFNSEQIDRIIANSHTIPAVNQIEVNPSLTQESLVTYCQKKGIVVMAHSPFGFMVDRESLESPPPAPNDPVLTKIAKKYGKTTFQVVLRYLVDRGTAPVPKSADKHRQKQNIDIYDFNLTEEEIAAINKFNSNTRVIKGVFWLDHPYYPFNKE
ncbi:aldo-keto reductase AKR2E4-like [Cydia pomonella]|uniref:aldo-keto reductase AKR2E4-like n=1 Tax=Cydia pomonella TaxID=82600 RepID=UPI002ADD42D9|nr:aldo-keto reductase AKR2E4-like [Cydia pomonella]